MCFGVYHFFEIATFLIRKPLNHATVIAVNSQEFLRRIISCNCILLENKEMSS